MNVRGIKAYVHRNCIADVVNALCNAGFKSLKVIDVEGVLKALNTTEQRYSVEIGQKVVKEVKLELVCETDNRTARAVALIREHAKTGHPAAGWIYLLRQRLAAMDEQTDRRIDARKQRRGVARFDAALAAARKQDCTRFQDRQVTLDSRRGRRLLSVDADRAPRRMAEDERQDNHTAGRELIAECRANQKSRQP